MRRRGRRLRLRSDGRLYDLDERRCVGLDELCEDLRAGRPFRAYRQHTGTEATNQVLVDVLRAALPRRAGLSDLLRRPRDRDGT